jgi:hypothetical protein
VLVLLFAIISSSGRQAGAQDQIGEEETTTATATMFSGTQQKCKVCTKTVYPMDQLSTDGAVFHRACFKCHHCKSTLSVWMHVALLSSFLSLHIRASNFSLGDRI